MLLNELIDELKRLPRADKLRVMQVLVNELAAEENALLVSNTPYEIFTPYGNEAAAQILYEALQVEVGKESDEEA